MALSVWPEAETPLGGVFEEAQRSNRLVVLLQKEGELPTHQGVPVTPEQRDRWEQNGERVFIVRFVKVKSEEAEG